MSDIEIKFTTKAELEAAKQTAQAVKEVSKAADQAAEASDKSSAQWNKFKDAIRGLSAGIPGLSRLIGALANPISAAALLIGTVTYRVQAWSAGLKELHRTIEQSRAFDKLAWDAGTTAEQLQRSRVEAGKFSTELASASVFADTLAASLKAVNEELRLKQSLANEEADREMALQMASVDELEAGGKISRVEAIRRRGDIAGTFERSKAEREASVAQAEIQAQRQAVNDLAFNLENKKRSIPGLRNAYEATLGPANAAESNAQARIAEAQGYQSQLAERQHRMAEISRTSKEARTMLERAEYLNLANEVRGLTTEYESAKKAAETARAIATKRATERDSAASALNSAEAGVLKDGSRLQDMHRDLLGMENKERLTSPSRNRGLQFGQQTREAKVRVAEAEETRKAEEDRQRKRSKYGEAPDSPQAERLSALRARVEALPSSQQAAVSDALSSLDRAVGGVERGAGVTAASLQSALRNFEQPLKKLESWNLQLRPPLPGQ